MRSYCVLYINYGLAVGWISSVNPLESRPPEQNAAFTGETRENVARRYHEIGVFTVCRHGFIAPRHKEGHFTRAQTRTLH